MNHPHGVVGHWKGDWDEPALVRWIQSLRARLDAPAVTLGLIFPTTPLLDRATELLDLVRVYGQVPLLAGCSTHALVCEGHEYEPSGPAESGFTLGLYALPGARLTARHIGSQAQEAVENAPNPTRYWQDLTGITPENSRGWLAFMNPFGWEGERWISQWNVAYPGIPCIGGLATGNWEDPLAHVYLNGTAHEEGAVLINFSGDVALETMVSQGCTPIGQPWTITKADRNFIHSIANQPAYKVLVDTFNGLPRDQQRRVMGNVFVGFASSEYREELRRGDFLVRNLLMADPGAGVLAVGAQPRTGQTIQFQTRDATSATEDLGWQLARLRERLAGREIYGGFLGVCGGRGQRLFGVKDHDAAMVQGQLGAFPLIGCFCNGEIGPVGGRNFLHGYTATLGLFVGSPVTTP